ncbi:OmpA family protein [Flavobacteriaceae bacterium]|nr:OmpA family protein [Flavobacteriaceae bacterium]MDB4152016.1 OmpA family protein [Flavobacteriaceae bacterium]MDB9989039.1 OmpA family protein [Flavobacteriaceae bacterium]
MKKIILLTLTAVSLVSCVSSKMFNEIEGNYAQLKVDHAVLEKENSELLIRYDSLRYHYGELMTQFEQIEMELDRSKKSYETLEDSYKALEQNSNAALQESIEQNRGLLDEIQLKESELSDERSDLDSLQNELASKIARVNELERVIANKEALLSKLKSSLSKALLSFDGKGLTVEQRNGKVYVSMENKLLFKSGSWAVGSEGKQAIKQLAMVLEQNKDISVLIEGHTDDDPYIGDSKLSGNWDLSVKRATAIVRLLLQNKGVMPENITAAGKGEYSPVVPNSSADNRSKNRRIEVILAPKLDEIGKLLQDLD